MWVYIYIMKQAQVFTIINPSYARFRGKKHRMYLTEAGGLSNNEPLAQKGTEIEMLQI